MRLLDTATLQLKEFFGDATPPYAILSHTWEEDEVSLQALATARHNVPELAGHTKIRKCCEIAASDGFQYVWIDTCCIDKTNSTELSEAINSMYRWYEEAVVCYAYLADVYPTDEIIRFRERQSSANQFKTSKWFTRGWTLQELLAPSTVVFFNKTWEDIGSKRSLNELISDVTKIPLVALLKFDRTKHTIAQIMSWASNRRTTRVEDIAYSLLGLFGVHMPMIYGEGRNAFARLQREILKESTDQSIFAWAPSHTGEWEQYRGPFATSPAEFAVCGGVTHYHNPSHSEYSLTNKGLRIELPVLALSSSVL
ncbi:HET-domain-containing protein, partial [Lophium mytilinum]